MTQGVDLVFPEVLTSELYVPERDVMVPVSFDGRIIRINEIGVHEYARQVTLPRVILYLTMREPEEFFGITELAEKAGVSEPNTKTQKRAVNSLTDAFVHAGYISPIVFEAEEETNGDGLANVPLKVMYSPYGSQTKQDEEMPAVSEPVRSDSLPSIQVVTQLPRSKDKENDNKKPKVLDRELPSINAVNSWLSSLDESGSYLSKLGLEKWKAYEVLILKLIIDSQPAPVNLEQLCRRVKSFTEFAGLSDTQIARNAIDVQKRYNTVAGKNPRIAFRRLSNQRSLDQGVLFLDKSA